MMKRRFFPDGGERRRNPAATTGAAGLAERKDFPLGNVVVRPSTRTVSGPRGDAAIEPKVMEVLLALADASGRVLTRADLTERCWRQQAVGDDSINRAISEGRRALRDAGADFAIENVPKIGYRIAGATPAPSTERRHPRSFSRRHLLAIAGGASAVAVAAAAFRWSPHRTDPRVAALLDRGQQALRDEAPNSTEQGVGFLQEATRLDPAEAQAWGLLALALRNAAEYAPRNEIATTVSACQAAARRAITLEPNQAEAEAALALLPAIYGDWLAREAALRNVLARHPDQVDLLSGLGLLLFSVGRADAAAQCSARAAGLYPLSPVFQYRRAYHLWSLGKAGEADRTIDRALQLWPVNPSVRYARMLIFAGSGRPDAARRLLSDPDAPRTMPPSIQAAWLATLGAQQRADADGREQAVALNMAAARESGVGCINAILGLSLAGALDEAFEVARGFLLSRGPLISVPGAAKSLVNDQRWRKTMMLFVPATAALRADGRFADLCSGMGLTKYWRKAGVTPTLAHATVDIAAGRPATSARRP